MNVHTHSTPSKHPSVGRHPDRPARTRVRPTEEPSDTQAGGFSSTLRRVLIAVGITMLTAVLLTTAAAVALYNSPDPTPWILPVSAAALALASLCGGITAGKLNPTAPVAAGLLSGGLTAALLLLISLIFRERGGLVPWAMGSDALLASLMGSVWTRPRKRAPSHGTGGHHTHR